MTFSFVFDVVRFERGRGVRLDETDGLFALFDDVSEFMHREL